MQPLTKEYKMSVCEIKTLENEFLTSGVITEVTDEYIQIGSYHGDRLPLMPFDRPVKILVHNLKSGFRVVAGTAYLSTDQMLRVVGVETLQNFERRGFFRITTKLPAKASVKDSITKEFSDDVDIMVENLSLSGLLFSFEKEHRALQLGDHLLVDLRLPQSKMTMNCRVTRIATYRTKDPRYGCEFFDHTQKEADKLCFYIFEQQRNMIRKKKGL